MNNSKKILFISAVCSIITIVFDQLTKIWITPLKSKDPIVLIKNVLEITYLENKGAAFGIMEGQRIIFLVMAFLVLFFIAYIAIKIPAEPKYYLLDVLLVLILSGAIGNTIDRILYGYVRDFIYFRIIDFPVFNVADIYITVSTFLLIFAILFHYKDSDLDFFKTNKSNTDSEDADNNINENED